MSLQIMLCGIMVIAGTICVSAVAPQSQKPAKPPIASVAKSPVQDASEPAQKSTAEPVEGNGYKIDQPGTITFTVGVKIKGKVEKPQVMIFLPKEKPFYREVKLVHSFEGDLMEPLPFVPLLP